MLKVSVIVPVYNVEKELERCLNSLVKQTLKEIEIIVINDESPDQSNLIMHRFAQKYTMIRPVYLEKNRGPGGARNQGISLAQGEYIAFIDGDDYVTPEYLEKLYNKAVNTGSDIVYSGFLAVNQNGDILKQRMLVSPEQAGVLANKATRMILFEDFYVWGKIIKKNLIIEHEITFPENKLYEDIPFSRICFLYANKIDAINECLYYYTQREASTMHQTNNPSLFHEAEMALLFYEECAKRGFLDKYPNEIKGAFALTFCLWPIHNCVERYEDIPEGYLSFISSKIKEIYPEYLSDKYLYVFAEPRAIAYSEINDFDRNLLIDLIKEDKIRKMKYHFYKYYQLFFEEINSLIKRYYDEKKVIAIWGAGRKGNDFLETFDSKNEFIKYVFDKNKEMYGCKTGTGHRIVDYHRNIADVVLITNRHFYYEIEKELQGYGSITVNIDMYCIQKAI